MSEISTKRVRDGYVHHRRVATRSPSRGAKGEFDAWLTSELRAAKAEAFDHGVRLAVNHITDSMGSISYIAPTNPYREDET